MRGLSKGFCIKNAGRLVLPARSTEVRLFLASAYTQNTAVYFHLQIRLLFLLYPKIPTSIDGY